MSINDRLSPFQRFGVNLGLTRIEKLLANLGNPHDSVAIVHVGGTNGKGSVCAYLSSILTHAGYKVGRYTSPHLVSWTERLCINEIEIPDSQLEAILQEVIATISPEDSPTQFEVFTAAAWLYFARNAVDIAIVEVGLGGRLDATNVCAFPLVSVITSLSREHWQVLGDTVAEIAGEKAGILKANCPAVLGQLPPEAEAVIKDTITALNCPAIWVKPAHRLGENRVKYGEIEYSLPLAGDVQLMNSAIAIATISILQGKGWQISKRSIQKGIAQTRWRGRMQWYFWQQQKILIDGAHNPEAAQGLRRYIDTLNQPIAWVMGILASKDSEGILRALLRRGDRLFLVPVPEKDCIDPAELARVAQQIYPDFDYNLYTDLFPALEAAMTTNHLVVLCGSLYLLGYFFQETSPIGDRRI